MCPYYLTALIALLGPVARATGSAQMPFPEKTNPDPLAPDFGQPFAVETATTVSGTLDMARGTVVSLVATCDVPGYNPRLEVYGTEGILVCNDPNTFGGPVYIRRGGDREEVPLSHGFSENSRGLGVADMVHAIREGRPHRASGELMYHVLDVSHALHDASREGRHQQIGSTVARPEPFVPGVQGIVL